MKYEQLGMFGPWISKFSLGTMTFGEQVTQSDSFNILDAAVDSDINFIDCAEIYSNPSRASTYGLSETILGQWLSKKRRDSVIITSKVAGPSRGYDWVRNHSGMTPDDIIVSCEQSLKRLKTDYIDVYYIHWPERYTSNFGELYFDPEKYREDTLIEEQLVALKKLIDAGKIRYIGLSNETPYGIHEFLRCSSCFDLPKIQVLQNPYSLTNRSYENGLDEMMFGTGISMVAYSPLGFGMLTGKYDETFDVAGRLNRYPEFRERRWCRPMAIEASRKYNALARSNDIKPTHMALAYCYNKWSITSTLLGVTSVAQLMDNLKAQDIELSRDLLKEIDNIRWNYRDPAQ